VACRLDRLHALGNGQVPAVAAKAWQMLEARLRRHNAKLRDAGESGVEQH
jgi:hypothetical protein